MTEQLKQDAINIVAFAHPPSADKRNSSSQTSQQPLTGAGFIDEAIGSLLLDLLLQAEATPSEKDEEWVTTLRDLYIAIKRVCSLESNPSSQPVKRKGK